MNIPGYRDHVHSYIAERDIAGFPIKKGEVIKVISACHRGENCESIADGPATINIPFEKLEEWTEKGWVTLID